MIKNTFAQIAIGFGILTSWLSVQQTGAIVQEKSDDSNGARDIWLHEGPDWCGNSGKLSVETNTLRLSKGPTFLFQTIKKGDNETVEREYSFIIILHDSDPFWILADTDVEGLVRQIRTSSRIMGKNLPEVWTAYFLEPFDWLDGTGPIRESMVIWPRGKDSDDQVYDLSKGRVFDIGYDHMKHNVVVRQLRDRLPDTKVLWSLRRIASDKPLVDELVRWWKGLHLE